MRSLELQARSHVHPRLGPCNLSCSRLGTSTTRREAPAKRIVMSDSISNPSPHNILAELVFVSFLPWSNPKTGRQRRQKAL